MALGKILLLALPVAIIAMTTRDDEEDGPTEPASTPPGGSPPPPPPARPPPPSKPSKPPTKPGGGFIDSLPEAYSQAREDMILSGVDAGLYDTPQYKMVSSMGAAGTELEGYKIAVPVMTDALKFDGVRIITDYRTAQYIADKLGMLMLTPYVDALSYEQADARLTPTTMSPVTANKSQMIQASAAIDKKLAAAGGGEVPLVGNAGKVWVLTIKFSWPGVHPETKVPHTEAAANHGLYLAPWQPIQNVGVAHNLVHTDYSQMLRYMGPDATLTFPDGTHAPIKTATVLMDATLAPLLTGQKGVLRGKQVGEGPLPYDRHPAIPPAGVIV